jgi:hypothetical protein
MPKPQVKWDTEPQVRIAYDAMRKSHSEMGLPAFDDLDASIRTQLIEMWERGMMLGILGAAEKMQ